MIEKYVTTDLACERIKCTNERSDKDTEYKEESSYGFEIHDLRIKTKEGERNTSVPMGEYVTVYYENILHADEEKKHRLSLAISAIIRRMLPDNCNGVLIACIGNRDLSSDSIGPACAQKISATRHIKKHDETIFSTLGTKEISVLAPGVMSQTGLDSAEIFKGIARETSPDAVIVIDSLRARSIQRLGSTVQISDAGLTPGSGVGNAREALSEDTLGCKVISIGVPTVVSTSTLVYDILTGSGTVPSEQTCEKIDEGSSFFVVPNDIGELTECISEIISDAIYLSCES